MMDVAAIRVEALDYARNEGVLNKAKHHLVAVAKSVECKLDGIKSPSARRAGASFALALGIMLLFMLLTPHCAAAFGLDDLVNKVGEMIGSWTEAIGQGIMKFLNGTLVQPIANLMLKCTLGDIKNCVSASDLLCDFDHLLGNTSGKLTSPPWSPTCPTAPSNQSPPPFSPWACCSSSSRLPRRWTKAAA